jgi:hypothetical protein
MSMEHKAYSFNYDEFTATLAPILFAALANGDVQPLMRYIEENREHLTDPYEGDPLDAQWTEHIEPMDAHQLGDFALTRFYSPREDIGLGYTWEASLEDVRREVDENAEAIVLGEPFGPSSHPFDPGKMGSYFQSWESVHRRRAAVAQVLKGHHSDTVADVAHLLSRPDDARLGLYVTY